MIQIFPDPPREGEPISKRGIAAGLRRMARAWETLTVEGGTVQWLAGRPKIVFSGDTADSDGDATDVGVKNSIEFDDASGTEEPKLQLVGDEDDPGAHKYYGTASGDKGFHDVLRKFIELDDTPSSYTDQDGKYLKAFSSFGGLVEGVEFADGPREVPTGGQQYQVLQKTGSGDNDFGWDWTRWP
jgi:hypothetical protein